MFFLPVAPEGLSASAAIEGYGFLDCPEAGPGGAHILNLAVHRDHRRKKIGARLLSLLLDVANRHGITRVTLEVRASNTTAQAVYRRFGFTPVAVRENYYVLEKEDALVMERRAG